MAGWHMAVWAHVGRQEEREGVSLGMLVRREEGVDVDGDRHMWYYRYVRTPSSSVDVVK